MCDVFGVWKQVGIRFHERFGTDAEKVLNFIRSEQASANEPDTARKILQRSLYKIGRPSLFSLSGYLKKRFQCWGNPEEVLSHFKALCERWATPVSPGIMVHEGRVYTAPSPPAPSLTTPPVRHLIAMLRWFLNGFFTARRFQQEACCLFCGRGADSIEHIAMCPVLIKVARDLGFLRHNATSWGWALLQNMGHPLPPPLHPRVRRQASS